MTPVDFCLEDTCAIPNYLMGRHMGADSQRTDRLTVSMRMVKHLEDKKVWSRSDTAARLHYPLLIDALNHQRIAAYIGWGHSSEMADLDLERAVELMHWLFGDRRSKNGGVVCESDPCLFKLNLVLDHPKAIDTLRKYNNLDEAYLEANDIRYAIYRERLDRLANA